jgi:N-acetylneuraminate synthase
MVEIIYECGINHNGDIGIAQKMIDIASSAGCNFVKFQKRDIDIVYSKEELDKPRESPFGTTTRDQKKGIEFDEIDYSIIDEYCGDKIPWIASPWDVNSLRMLANDFAMGTIKIPSALLTDIEFLGECKRLAKANYMHNFILADGMSTYDDLDLAISILGKEYIYCIMHCTSTYPTKPTEMNMLCIQDMKKRYPWAKIGFSNHYPGLMGMFLAVAYGAEMIEFHGTLDRTMYGSDQASSIEPQGVFKLVEGIKLIEQMKGDGIKKVYDSELPIIAKLRR